AAIPVTVHNPYALGLLTLLAIYGILLIGLDVTVGYLGQVNLAQAAFLGLGAYTAGLCVTRLGWGMPLATLAAIAVCTVLGAMSVGTYRHKVAAFALGSALGGLAGALYVFNFQYLQPQVFTYELTVILLLGVVLGGRKSLWGAFVGASLVALLPNLLSNRFLFEVISAVGFVL